MGHQPACSRLRRRPHAAGVPAPLNLDSDPVSGYGDASAGITAAGRSRLHHGWGQAPALRGSPSPQSSPINGEEESRSVRVGTVYFRTKDELRGPNDGEKVPPR